MTEKENGFYTERGNVMRSLNVYSEHIKNSPLGSIKENISASPGAEKETILNYLKSGSVIAAISGVAKDVFTNEDIKGEWFLMSDGVYEWSSDIIYYYEKYNLILLDEFIRYVLKQ